MKTPPRTARHPAPPRLASCAHGGPRTHGAPIGSVAARAPWLARLILFALALALAAPAPAAAQEATGLEGSWTGEISIPGSPLGITVVLTRADDGSWTGTIDIPAQGASAAALEQVRVEGDSVGFVIAGVPGAPTFAGVVSEAGDEISGTFTQGGQSFPFALTRRDAVDLSEALEGFDAWLLAQMEAWEVPGLALAVVRGGEVAHIEGYGLRNVADSLPVTPSTLFAIGSSSKAFTTALLGTLVDEGTLGWDDPVRQHLPEFTLADPAAAGALTVRDMVTHRSGLPRHDGIWYANPDLDRAEMVARLAHLPANEPLRAAWQYNNLMFIAAGYLAEQLEGESWENLVRARLFGPLGMERSGFSVRESQADPDHARPYDERGDTLAEVAFKVIDAVGPAGSINSTAEDMARWVQMHLAGGEFEGRTVLERGTTEALQTPAMVIGARPTDPAFGIMAYGLGWFLDSYRGHFRVHHGGNIDGFSALVSLFPHDDLGVVVLTNRNATPLPEFVVRQLADRIFEMEPRDWSREALTGRDTQRARADSLAALGPEEREEGSDRVEGTTPTHPLDAYAGSYLNPGYGTVEVSLVDGGEGLAIRYYDLALDLEHVHYDVFETVSAGESSPFAGVRVRFRTGFDGGVEALDLPLEPSLPAAAFTRAPDDRLTDPAFLDRLAGAYRLDGQVVQVRRQGTELVATIPGQPPYVLVPGTETTFTLEVAPQIRVSFEVPTEGPAAALTFHQPNGTFRYARTDG
jgi:CubicO group peptidase (beta-lactamase class C family)